MKKNKFLNGLGAKMALAVVALATMFTSCSNESIEIEVTPVNAKAYVTPIVIANGVDVTSSAVITPGGNAIGGVGNWYYEGNPDLTATTVTFSATYQAPYGEMTGSESIDIPAVSRNNSTAKVVKIFLSYTTSNVEATVKEIITTEDVENTTVIKSLENASDKKETVSFTYTNIEGSKVVESNYNGTDEAILAEINKFNKAYSETEKTIELEVAPYTVLTPKVTTEKTVSTYTVQLKSRATGEALATFTVEDYTTEVTTTSAIIPGHGGHDGGHGNGGNAGGGFSDAD